MERLLRHRQTKGAETDKQLLMAIESQPFTLPEVCIKYSPDLLGLLRILKVLNALNYKDFLRFYFLHP